MPCGHSAARSSRSVNVVVQGGSAATSARLALLKLPEEVQREVQAIGRHPGRTRRPLPGLLRRGQPLANGIVGPQGKEQAHARLFPNPSGINRRRHPLR
jgi:hypothetical protein